MKQQSSRFVGPTAGLNLKRLLNRSLYILGIGLVVALGVHAFIMFQSLRLGPKERVSKPLMVRFIQRAPRLTKPLELRKRPAPRRRELTRQRINIKAKSPKLLTTYVGGIGISSLASGIGTFRESWSIGDLGFKLAATEPIIKTAKEPKSKIDMEASLLRLEDLDTGRYKAMVIQNPKNKRKIRGYLYVAELMSPAMLEHQVRSIRQGYAAGLHFGEFVLPQIVEAMNTYTDIKVKFAKRVAMSDKELMDIPWVIIANRSTFFPAENELENLGRYLISGGFLFLDAGTQIGGGLDINYRDIIRRALAKVGRPCRFYKLPYDHPIFHAFFDFDRVPLARQGTRYTRGRTAQAFPDYLIGVDVDGRLAVVFSYVLATRSIHNTDTYNRNEEKGHQNLRILQFMVNTIVFALTQKGSITHRVMETIK